MDRVDPKDAGVAICGGIELADQSVAVQDREGEESPATLGVGLAHLQLVVEVEELHQPLTIVDQPVERGQQGDPPRDRLIQPERIDPPFAPDTLDHRQLADVDAVDRALQPAGSGDTQGTQQPLAAGPQRLVDGDDQVVGIDPRRQVPQPVPPTRPATATSSRATRKSSILMTFRLLVHPADRHGRTHVSGNSREVSGPSPRSHWRMASRQVMLVSTQSRRSCCQSRNSPRPGHSAISARNSTMSSARRANPCRSISRCSAIASSSSVGSYDDPSRSPRRELMLRGIRDCLVLDYEP